MAFKIFGTDGIRQIPGEFPLIPEILSKTLSFFSKNNKNIILGFDTRDSSLQIATLILNECKKLSLNCVSAGYLSTPAVSFLTKTKKFDLGIMITASHNPYSYNGIKFFNSNGEKLSREEEIEIENFLSQFKFPKRSEFKLKLDENLLFSNAEYFRKIYTDWLTENFLILSNNFLREYKIAFDLANGSLSVIVPEIFEKFSNLKIFFHTFDGKNINKECGATHPDAIIKRVKELNFDYGISFDGDGDRLLVCDGEKIYNGDYLIYIFANYLKKNGKLNNNTVCGTILSGLGLELSLKKRGIKLLRSDVGDRNVYYLMKENGVILGGEESGHIILRDYLPTGDGLLSFLFLCTILENGDPSLKELAGDFYETSLLKYNIPYNEKKDLETLKSVKNLKMWLRRNFSENFRIVVRYSGTEKYLRIVIEGNKEMLKCNEDINFLIKKISEELK